MPVEIERCSTCTHECDDFYRRSATDILFQTHANPELYLEDKKQLLILCVKGIGKCALTVEKVEENLDALIEVTEEVRGREEIRIR